MSANNKELIYRDSYLLPMLKNSGQTEDVKPSKNILLKLNHMVRDNNKRCIFELPKLKDEKKFIIVEEWISNRNILKSFNATKVVNIEFLNIKKTLLKKKINNKVSIEDKHFYRYIVSLNKYCIAFLEKKYNYNVRKYSKINKIDKIALSELYNIENNRKLTSYAINNLYYSFAPKESNKYKVYKYAIVLSSLIIILGLFMVVNWVINGIKINNLSKSINENMVVIQSSGGDLVNITEPDNNSNINISEHEKNLYWKYVDTPFSAVNFDDLRIVNKDTVGWLIVNNTNINYPVVQTNNNEYYLTHAFDKSKNNAGWVFADYRDNFENLNENTVIYAHGRKDKVMFGSLSNALDAKWYSNYDNQIIQLSTLNYNTMWQIFSVYKTEAESYYITTNFSNDESFSSFIESMKKRSIYDFGINVSVDDKLLTLSTCYNNDGIRMVVQAKLVKIQKRTS